MIQSQLAYLDAWVPGRTDYVQRPFAYNFFITPTTRPRTVAFG